MGSAKSRRRKRIPLRNEAIRNLAEATATAESRISDHSASVKSALGRSGVTITERLRRRIDPACFVIFLVPFVVLFRDRNPALTAVGTIDPWVYYGFFRNLVNFKRILFRNTYYGSRLTWILPGFVVNQCLPPLAANYVLHLGVHCTAMCALYFTLKLITNRGTALLATMAFGFYPYLWHATGWDYVDGIGIAYYLLCTFFLTAACFSNRLVPLKLTLAGAAFAGLVFSNIVWVIFTPFFGAYYLFCDKSQRRLPSKLGTLVMWTALGAFIVTIVLCGIHYLVAGSLWFYAPSLNYAIGNVGKPNRWKYASYAWAKNAPWLFLPAFTLTFELVFWIVVWFRSAQPSKLRIVLSLNAILSILLLVGMEMCGFPILQLSYYASYLIPVMFLALGSDLFSISERAVGEVLWVVALAILMLGLPWVLDRSPYLPWDRLGEVSGNVLVTSAGLVVLFTRSRYPDRTWSLLVALLAMGLLTSYDGLTFARERPNGREKSFLRMADCVQAIESVRHGRMIRFWVRREDRLGLEYDSLNSIYLWRYTNIGHNFPEHTGSWRIPENVVVVVLSASKDTPEIAANAFAAAALDLRLLKNAWIERENAGYSLSIFEASPRKAASSSLQD